VAFLVLARRFAAEGRWGWVAFSVGTASVLAVTFGLAGTAFRQADGLAPVGGLFQRIAVVTGWIWLTLLSIQRLRQLNRPRRQPPPPASPPPAGVLARVG
jgi:hypothetical protein